VTLPLAPVVTDEATTAVPSLGNEAAPSPSTRRRCRGIARSGGTCQVINAVFADDRCVFHSETEEAEARRSEMRLKAQLELQELRKRRGLLKRSPPPPPPTDLDGALAYTAWALHELAAGRLSADEMKALDKLLTQFGALTKARDADRKLAEAQRLMAEFKAAKARP
jgi:hypothetical protein